MKLTFRQAGPGDVAALVELYDRHYHGGHSATLDRYGPATPQDVWWVQSEKSLSVIELNRNPAGLIIVGKSGKRLLAEEVLLDRAPEGREEALDQVHTYLTRIFQRARQDVLTVRCAETNAFTLAMAARYGFTFANALLVAAGGSIDAAVPHGYAIRRATVRDAPSVGRLHEDTLGFPLHQRDLDALWRGSGVRVFLAEREGFPVAIAIVQIRDGMGRWSIGVREGHRRKGIGRALAHQALQFIRAAHVPAVTTYWGTDGIAARFIHALGVRTERTYLYFERRL